MQYMEVPMSNSSQILDGFFAETPQPTPTAAEVEIKVDYEVEKVFKSMIFIKRHCVLFTIL